MIHHAYHAWNETHHLFLALPHADRFYYIDFGIVERTTLCDCNMHTARNQLTFLWISGQSVHLQSRLQIHLAIRFPKEFTVSSSISLCFLPSFLPLFSLFLPFFALYLWSLIFLPFDKNVIVNTYRGTVVDILVSFPSIELSNFSLWSRTYKFT